MNPKILTQYLLATTDVISDGELKITGISCQSTKYDIQKYEIIHPIHFLQKHQFSYRYKTGCSNIATWKEAGVYLCHEGPNAIMVDSREIGRLAEVGNNEWHVNDAADTSGFVVDECCKHDVENTSHALSVQFKSYPSSSAYNSMAARPIGSVAGRFSELKVASEASDTWLGRCGWRGPSRSPTWPTRKGRVLERLDTGRDEAVAGGIARRRTGRGVVERGRQFNGRGDEIAVCLDGSRRSGCDDGLIDRRTYSDATFSNYRRRRARQFGPILYPRLVRVHPSHDMRFLALARHLRSTARMTTTTETPEGNGTPDEQQPQDDTDYGTGPPSVDFLSARRRRCG
ncbi:uncharacterized protein ATNIH1004_011760 [Aspergillus tanneri]|uniref:Uncharacterized protein n=1 Tax=Aspergillus tanneri TaxID=1220188 RepID=A0A5M9M8F2_9EURO|nr:uncharacterized protein ATNIH1004_011760 [Aspergillus tanneri]KAA8641624.1 hypothetical protein ATNIH1004_011760 [Aspergillus tanneri]